MMENGKVILDPDSDVDQSENLTEYSLSKGLLLSEIHEHSSATFWVNLFNI